MSNSLIPSSTPQRRRLPLLLAGTLCCASTAQAADVSCPIGTRVEGEHGGGIAEIAEIGTQAPHAGWVRLLFSWNAPNGDWYDPRTWVLHPVGSTDRCIVAAPTSGVAAAPAPAAAAAAAPVLAPTRAPAVSTATTTPTAAFAPANVAPAPAGLAAGTYVCSTNGAGFFRITLDGEGEYTDRAGDEGDYELAADGALSFTSGSLEDTHARALGPGKFGLASTPTRSFHTVCNLKR
jgi:hypothetical protein